MEARSQLRHRPTSRRKNPRQGVAEHSHCPLAQVDSQTSRPVVLRKVPKVSILDVKRPVHPMNLTLTLTSVAFLSLVSPAWSLQVQVVPPPVPYTSVSELNGILGQLEQASEATQADLSKLRIEKWKADSGTKKQTLSNVDSIKRNLQGALPEIVTQLRNSPEDLSASFKIYRNLDALYDVLGNVTESAGAFGSKDEFQSLSNDLSALERSRHSFASRMENLTASKEAELNQLRTQARTLQAAVPPPPPKKIVVDDNEPKKPAPKKKTIPKPPAKQSATPVQPTQQAQPPK